MDARNTFTLVEFWNSQYDGPVITCQNCGKVTPVALTNTTGVCPVCASTVVIYSHAPQSLCSCLGRSRAENSGEEMQRKDEGSAEGGEDACP